jgi:signal transduction histidine kinase
LWIKITIENNVSWVESEIEWIQNINETLHKELVRTTTILKFDQNQWKIVHVHGSSPDNRFLDGDYMSNESTVSKNKELERQVFKRTQQLNESLEALKSTQSQLIQSEKMASLGELTAGIAHEIQNPLNFVNNFSDVNTELIDELEQGFEKGNLDEVKALSKDIRENEQKINHNGKRADAIVKGMLQHSRSSNGVKEPTVINALADEYLRLAYHGLRAKDKSFNATLKTDFDENIGKIEIIPQDIGRVVLNLTTNAFYACAERLRLSEAETSRSAVNEKKKLAGPDYEPTVSLRTRKTINAVELLVTDNGNGIPQKVVDKIFQPFFTTKPSGQGTGLGLSMSYDIVNAHGGELKVHTTEGEGSVFSVVLPA